jgi:hypothetical protein
MNDPSSWCRTCISGRSRPSGSARPHVESIHVRDDGSRHQRVVTKQHRDTFERRRDTTEKRRDGIERRRDGIEGRKDGIERRRDGIEGRKDGIERRRDGIEGRKDGIERRRDGIEGRRDGIERGRDGIERHRTSDERCMAFASSLRGWPETLHPDTVTMAARSSHRSWISDRRAVPIVRSRPHSERIIRLAECFRAQPERDGPTDDRGERRAYPCWARHEWRMALVDRRYATRERQPVQITGPAADRPSTRRPLRTRFIGGRTNFHDARTG